MGEAAEKRADAQAAIDFRTEPARYRHWKLAVDGEVATLTMDVDEKGGLLGGYELKLNSYDLGVDIELADAIERLRFEHPEVKVVVLQSGKDRVFCAGANIRMLASATHAHKVNFCKFTNETRNGIEDASEHSGPEISLRRERHRGRRRLRARARLRPHHAGGRRLGRGVAARAAAARRAARHRRAHPRHRQAQGAARPRRRVLHHRGRREGQARGRLAAGRRGHAALQARRGGRRRARRRIAAKSAAASRRRASRCTPLERKRSRRRATNTSTSRSSSSATTASPPSRCAARTARRPPTADAMVQHGAAFWPLQLARELDDAILDIRLNELEIATIVFKSVGDPQRVLAHETSSTRTPRTGSRARSGSSGSACSSAST